jgi:hypothetical protein
MTITDRNQRRPRKERKRFDPLPFIVFLCAVVLVQEGVGRLGQRVDGALHAAGFLSGPGPNGLMQVAGLPVLAVLLVLFLRRDLIGDRGLRLGAMGLGAGAGILLADPLARIIIYLGMPGPAVAGEGSVLRLTVNLLVLAVVGGLFAVAVVRELRRSGIGDQKPKDAENGE